MRVKIAIGCIFMGLTLAASACNALPASVPATATPEPGRWRIIPTMVEVEPVGAGWQSVRVELAFENGTQDFSTAEFATGNSYFTTEEGYTYPAQTYGHKWYSFPVDTMRVSHSVPPGFRTRGLFVHDRLATMQYVHHYTIEGRIAQNTHLSKLMIPAYGEIDLQKDVQEVVFPGEAYNIALKTAGEAIEIPGRAILTVEHFTREEVPGKWYDSCQFVDMATAYLRFQNLNPGYNESLAISFAFIGDDGLFYHSRQWGSECDPRLTAGPAQTVESQVCYAVPRTTRNLRLVLSGDVTAVYDTGF